MQFGNFKCILLFFLISSSLFSQNLEEQIYTALDSFIAKPDVNSLKELNQKTTAFLKTAKTADEKLAIVILFCNKGSFEMKNNLLQKAIKSYEQAWILFDKNKLSNYDMTEFCLKPLGTLYTKTGNFTLAENTIKKYVFLAEKQNDQATIISGYINLSIVYKSIGNYENAIALLSKAQNNKAANSQQKKRIQEELAVNLIGSKKLKEASKLVDNSTTSYQNLKTRSFIALQKGDFKEANDLFSLAKKAFFKTTSITSSNLAFLYTDEATLFAKQNNIIEAKNSYSKALLTTFPYLKPSEIPDKNLIFSDANLLRIFDGLAQLEENFDKKNRYFKLAFQTSDLLRSNIVSQEALFIHASEDRLRTELYIEFLWQTYQETKQAAHLLLAFQYAEKSKNTILRDKIDTNNLETQHPKNKNVVLKNQLIKEQESLTNTLIRIQISHENTENVAKLTNQLLENSIALKQVNEIINKEFPISNELLNISNLSKKLKEDNAQMLYFFFGKNSVYQFYLNNGKLVVKKIAATSNFITNCKQFIHYFDDASLINANLKGFQITSNQLFKNLNLENIEANKNTLLIPDGILNFVAFDALLTEKTTTTNYTEMPFLVRQNKIAYQTNAQFYIDNKRTKEAKTTLGIFPVFENTNAYLAYSIEESKSLQKYDNAKLLMNEDATKANFIANLPNYDILHLSTHGTSGTFNEPATLVFYDDLMLINELYALENCNPELVVLSACETGIGKLQKGEGASSIARGFQYAGAKNILFSLWRINDYAAAQWMEYFYKNKANSQSFFEANYQSKIDYLEDTEIANAKKSPYYWSAFVYYGAIDSQKPQYWLYILVSFAVLFLGGFVIRKLSLRKQKIIKSSELLK